MEYAEQLPASQTKRTLVTSIVALVIGAAAATGISAIADDDGSTASGSTSTPAAVSDDPGSQYGTAQYRLPNAQPEVPENTPYTPKYRFAHP
jgi:hypothetical protein